MYVSYVIFVVKYREFVRLRLYATDMYYMTFLLVCIWEVLSEKTEVHRGP